MTNQEKKAWLLQYRSLCRRIGRMKKEQAEWMERAENMNAPVNGLPHGSGVSDTVGFAVSKAADLAAEIGREIDQLADLRRDIEAAIQTAGDPLLQELLERRYIDGICLEEVAVIMHYSYIHVRRLHGKALSRITIR